MKRSEDRTCEVAEPTGGSGVGGAKPQGVPGPVVIVHERVGGLQQFDGVRVPDARVLAVGHSRAMRSDLSER